MRTAEIEQRLAKVERELAELKSQVVVAADSPNHWIEKIAGTFASPAAKSAFDQAMGYGRKWRKSQRPKSLKRKSARS